MPTSYHTGGMASASLCIILGLLIIPVSSNMIDVVMSHAMLSPPEACLHGCAIWADLSGSYNNATQTTVDSLWMNHSVEFSAGSACSVPGNFGVPEGALCYCAGTPDSAVTTWGYCGDPSLPTPQQTNLQFGVDGNHVQVAFVTLDHGAAQLSPPMVEFCNGVACLNLTGTTTLAPEPQNPTRVYSYHFVPLPSPLLAATTYSYRARGGTANGVWGQWKSMSTRSPAAPLRFALFGDQGVYPFNNMGNVLADRVRALSLPLQVHSLPTRTLARTHGMYLAGSRSPGLCRTPG